MTSWRFKFFSPFEPNFRKLEKTKKIQNIEVLWIKIYTAFKKSSHPHISEFDLASNFFRLWELGACYLYKLFFFTETTQNYLTNHVKMEYVTFFSAEES